MSEYYILSIDKSICNEGNETFVCVGDADDYDFVVELSFNSIISDNDIKGYIAYMNYPFRDRSYYICSEPYESGDGDLFSAHLSCEDFDCIVNVSNISFLKSFVYSINNPPVISKDMITDEYDKLSVEIDIEYGKIRKLERKRNNLIFKYLDRL